MKQLDLHGKNSFESEVLINLFLKEAFINKEYFICIIHGHGTMVLLRKTREILRDSKFVKSYEFAPQNYGGTGATIVYIKGEIDEKKKYDE